MTDYLTNPINPVGLGGTGFGGSDESPRVSYTLRVNGLERPVDEAWIGESLLYVLRERLGLAGAKGGCDQGECGACSVQVDGQLTAACLVPAALAADSEIRTVEGLAGDGSGTGSDVQRALAESGAVQCGYCVPGLAMAVHDLLERNHQPTELQAREALCGNLCRCTGYRGALAAVQAVARSRAEEAAAENEEPAAEPEQPAAAVESGTESGTGSAAEAEPAYTEPAYTEPVYAEIPAQQQTEQPPAEPAPPAELDPLFGPMHELAGAAPEPQYAGYPPQQGYPQGESYQGGYQQQPDHPGGEYPTGQFPVGEYGTGEYPAADYAPADYAPTDYGYQQTEYPADAFPLPGTPIPGQTGASPTGEPGVYVLPHQQQSHQQHHSPAPEAGA